MKTKKQKIKTVSNEVWNGILRDHKDRLDFTLVMAQEDGPIENLPKTSKRELLLFQRAYMRNFYKRNDEESLKELNVTGYWVPVHSSVKRKRKVSETLLKFPINTPRVFIGTHMGKQDLINGYTYIIGYGDSLEGMVKSGTYFRGHTDLSSTSDIVEALFECDTLRKMANVVKKMKVRKDLRKSRKSKVA